MQLLDNDNITSNSYNFVHIYYFSSKFRMISNDFKNAHCNHVNVYKYGRCQSGCIHVSMRTWNFQLCSDMSVGKSREKLDTRRHLEKKRWCVVLSECKYVLWM